MLWELITLAGATMFVAAGVQSARRAHAGVGGYALVITIGLILAVGYEYAAHKLADAVDDHLKGHSESCKKWCIRGFFLGSVVFLVIAAFVGDYVSSTLLRFV